MEGKNKKQLLNILIALVVSFVGLIGYIFLANALDVVQKISFLSVLFSVGGLVTILGIALTVLTFKQKVTGKLKIYLLLTGLSSAGFLLCTVLHNLLDAATTLTLPALFGFLAGLFFLLAIPVAPIFFLVGIIGSFVLLRK